MPKTEIPRKKGVKQFKPFRIPKIEIKASPFSRIGDKFILTEPFETQDYVKGKRGVKMTPHEEDRQILELKTVIDPEGGGDYKELQGAIDAGFKNIFLKKGTYVSTKNMVLPDDTTLVGENWEDVILDLGIYNITVGTDNIIENLTIDWDVNSAVPVIGGNKDNLIVSHCKLNYTGASLAAGGVGSIAAQYTGDNIIIEKCELNCQGTVINLGGDSSWIINNKVNTGAIANNGDNNYFVDNYVEHDGLQLVTSSGLNWTCRGNYIKNASATTGISNTGNYSKIIGNYIEGFTTRGIFDQADKGSKIINNTI